MCVKTFYTYVTEKMVRRFAESSHVWTAAVAPKVPLTHPLIHHDLYRHLDTERMFFSVQWLSMYPWLQKCEDGMLCSLCIKHKCMPLNGTVTWNTRPCCTYREAQASGRVREGCIESDREQSDCSMLYITDCS